MSHHVQRGHVLPVWEPDDIVELIEHARIHLTYHPGIVCLNGSRWMDAATNPYTYMGRRRTNSTRINLVRQALFSLIENNQTAVRWDADSGVFRECTRPVPIEGDEAVPEVEHSVDFVRTGYETRLQDAQAILNVGISRRDILNRDIETRQANLEQLRNQSSERVVTETTLREFAAENVNILDLQLGPCIINNVGPVDDNEVYVAFRPVAFLSEGNLRMTNISHMVMLSDSDRAVRSMGSTSHPHMSNRTTCLGGSDEVSTDRLLRNLIQVGDVAGIISVMLQWRYGWNRHSELNGDWRHDGWLFNDESYAYEQWWENPIVDVIGARGAQSTANIHELIPEEIVSQLQAGRNLPGHLYLTHQIFVPYKASPVFWNTYVPDPVDENEISEQPTECPLCKRTITAELDSAYASLCKVCNISRNNHYRCSGCRQFLSRCTCTPTEWPESLIIDARHGNLDQAGYLVPALLYKNIGEPAPRCAYCREYNNESVILRVGSSSTTARIPPTYIVCRSCFATNYPARQRLPSPEEAIALVRAAGMEV